MKVVKAYQRMKLKAVRKTMKTSCYMTQGLYGQRDGHDYLHGVAYDIFWRFLYEF